MKKMRKSFFKVTLVIALLLALIGITVTTYAYWDTLLTNQSETITIGEGQEVVVVPVQVKPVGKVLIPVGIAPEADEVNQVVLTYNVELNKTETDDLTLSVSAENVTLDDDETYNSLVNIDITLDQTNINSGTVVLVTVTVTLDVPADVTEYNAVKGKTISFNLKFQAA